MIDTMQESLENAIKLEATAVSFRKKGDALRKRGREEAASQAYRSGLAALNEALGLLRSKDGILRAARPLPPGDAAPDLYELVEIYGALGGMHQRLGELDESLASYVAGADLEERLGLAATYNRLNAVKSSILTGAGPLRSFEAKIRTLANLIETSVRTNRKLGDHGWAWADLGDCLALLGRTDEAGRAYATFIEKAEIKSPERTLDILKGIAAKLQANGDSDASRVVAAIDDLQARLFAR